MFSFIAHNTFPKPSTRSSIISPTPRRLICTQIQTGRPRRQWSPLTNGTPCQFVRYMTIDDRWSPMTIENTSSIRLTQLLTIDHLCWMTWKLWWCGMTHGWWCGMTCHIEASTGITWHETWMLTWHDTSSPSFLHQPSIVRYVIWSNFNTSPNSLILDPSTIDNLKGHLVKLQHFAKIVDPWSIGHRQFLLMNFNTSPNSLIPDPSTISDLKCLLAELQYFEKLVDPRYIGHQWFLDGEIQHLDNFGQNPGDFASFISQLRWSWPSILSNFPNSWQWIRTINIPPFPNHRDGSWSLISSLFQTSKLYQFLNFSRTILGHWSRDQTQSRTSIFRTFPHAIVAIKRWIRLPSGLNSSLQLCGLNLLKFLDSSNYFKLEFSHEFGDLSLQFFTIFPNSCKPKSVIANLPDSHSFHPIPV